MIEEDKVMKNYNFLKKRAYQKMSRGKVGDALFLYKTACNYMYHYNILFLDDEIENNVKQGIKTILPMNETETDKNKILFYQYIPKNERGLARIYLEALIHIRKEFAWITYKSYKTEKEDILLNIVHSCERARIYYVDDTQGAVKLLRDINKIIQKEKPSQALLIPAPWDVEILGLLAQYKNIKKILINGTDHAYWYGTSIFDLVLEFRNFGYTISKRYRKIDINKLDCLPYFPHPTGNLFAGLPFTLKESEKLIVSGGSLYKIYGSNVFFEIVSFILDTYQDTKFYFMGNGDSAPILEFIKKHNYEKRFFYTKERPDFDEVIKKAYLYLNTYPMLGGLMTQYAVANGVFPVGICEEWDKGNDAQELFINSNIEMMYKSKEDLLKELRKLFENEDYYKKKRIL